jgi:phage-related protein
MLTFPRLKTGVSMQYPVGSVCDRPVRVLTFLDGKEQRFPIRRGRKRWVIHLEQLDESEAAKVEAFVRAHLLTFEPFQFSDPVSGSVYGRCRLEGIRHEVSGDAVKSLRTTLVIAEEGD